MSKKTILVVDDFESARQLLEGILTPLGYNVTFAASGEEAVRAVKAKPPDLILMDIEMPVMDGYTACRTLKEDSQTVGIPLLMQTVLDETDSIRNALHHGADGYIMKPIQADEVKQKVAQMLNIAGAGKLPGRFYMRAKRKSGPSIEPSNPST